MQRLIAHRQETGSFDGDVEAFCSAIIRNVRLGKATRQITEAPGGRAIEIVNKPLPSGGWVATIEDITPRKRAEEKIAHLAHYDALTDLPNRVLFREEARARAEGTAAPAPSSRCSISTSTNSRASTTRSAIPSATSC